MLKCKLDSHATPHKINGANKLQMTLSRLCVVIKSIVDEYTPFTRPCLKTKRWWTASCAKARQRLNRIGSKVHMKYFKMTNPIHAVFWQVREKYAIH